MIALAGECRRRENNSKTVFFSKFNKKKLQEKHLCVSVACRLVSLAEIGLWTICQKCRTFASSKFGPSLYGFCFNCALITGSQGSAIEFRGRGESMRANNDCAMTSESIRATLSLWLQWFSNTHTLEEVYARAVHCLIISSLYCPFCFNQKYIRRCVLFWKARGGSGGNSHTKINDFQCQHSRIVDDDDRGLGRGTLNFFQKSPKSVSQPLCTAVPLPSNGWPDEEGAQGLLFCFVFAPGNSNDDEWMSASRQSRISTWWSWVSCEMVVAQVHKSTSSSSLVHSQLINESQEVWFDFLLCCCCWRTKFLSEEPTSVVVCQSSFNNTNYNNCTLAGMLCNL